MHWTPSKIRELRERRDQTQTRFGLELYDTTEETAQVLVSELERGKMRPGRAAQRPLNRMKLGEL